MPSTAELFAAVVPFVVVVVVVFVDVLTLFAVVLVPAVVPASAFSLALADTFSPVVPVPVNPAVAPTLDADAFALVAPPTLEAEAFPFVAAPTLEADALAVDRKSVV